MNILNDWNHKWYGIWSMGLPSKSAFPRVQDAIDIDWLPPDKNRLIQYCEECYLVDVLGMEIPCELCGAELQYGHRTDGEWLWHTTLAHFMREHNVVIPEQFADHIRRNNFVARTELKCKVEQLPWPEGYAIKRLRRSDGVVTVDGIRIGVDTKNDDPEQKSG